ncbi:MAG: hypothetical protein HY791_21980 [Deltaproteobacteria bacterium]|nr:hypothetical protein [Deltaproteobacteria bacterium]
MYEASAFSSPFEILGEKTDGPSIRSRSSSKAPLPRAGSKKDAHFGPSSFRVAGATIESEIGAAGPRLVQRLRIRKAVPGADTARRDLNVRRLAERTNPVGVQREPGGETVLSWVLPFVELRRGEPTSLRGAEAMRTALSLAVHLARAHGLGATCPLLSEELVVQTKSGPKVLEVVPAAVAPEWLAEGELPARFAPEERQACESTESGDLWRLGEALSALARRSPDCGLAGLAERLRSPNPSDRPARATQVIVELEALGQAAGLTPIFSGTTEARALKPGELEELLARTVDPSNPVCLPPEVFDVGVIDFRDTIVGVVSHPIEDPSVEPPVEITSVVAERRRRSIARRTPAVEFRKVASREEKPGPFAAEVEPAPAQTINEQEAFMSSLDREAWFEPRTPKAMPGSEGGSLARLGALAAFAFALGAVIAVMTH